MLNAGLSLSEMGHVFSEMGHFVLKNAMAAFCLGHSLELIERFSAP